MAKIAGHWFAYFSTTSGSAGYTWTSIGSSREGFRHVQTNHHQPVIDDRGGEAMVDAIQQGADVVVSCDYIDYDLIRLALYGSGGAGAPTKQGLMYDNVGKRMSDIAGSLLLMPRLGTPAAAMTANQGRQYFKAFIETDFEELLASKLFQGPCRFRCLPDPATSDKIWDYVVGTAAPLT